MITIFGFALLLTVFCFGSVEANAESGSFRFELSDKSSGDKLPGETITVSVTDSVYVEDFSVDVTTNVYGEAYFEGAYIGVTYNVDVEIPGYKPFHDTITFNPDGEIDFEPLELEPIEGDLVYFLGPEEANEEQPEVYSAIREPETFTLVSSSIPFQIVDTVSGRYVIVDNFLSDFMPEYIVIATPRSVYVDSPEVKGITTDLASQQKISFDYALPQEKPDWSVSNMYVFLKSQHGVEITPPLPYEPGMTVPAGYRYDVQLVGRGESEAFSLLYQDISDQMPQGGMISVSVDELGTVSWNMQKTQSENVTLKAIGVTKKDRGILSSMYPDEYTVPDSMNENLDNVNTLYVRKSQPSLLYWQYCDELYCYFYEKPYQGTMNLSVNMDQHLRLVPNKPFVTVSSFMFERPFNVRLADGYGNQIFVAQEDEWGYYPPVDSTLFGLRFHESQAQPVYSEYVFFSKLYGYYADFPVSRTGLHELTLDFEEATLSVQSVDIYVLAETSEDGQTLAQLLEALGVTPDANEHIRLPQVVRALRNPSELLQDEALLPLHIQVLLAAIDPLLLDPNDWRSEFNEYLDDLL